MDLSSSSSFVFTQPCLLATLSFVIFLISCLCFEQKAKMLNRNKNFHLEMNLKNMMMRVSLNMTFLIGQTNNRFQNTLFYIPVSGKQENLVPHKACDSMKRYQKTDIVSGQHCHGGALYCHGRMLSMVGPCPCQALVHSIAFMVDTTSWKDLVHDKAYTMSRTCPRQSLNHGRALSLARHFLLKGLFHGKGSCQ